MAAVKGQGGGEGASGVDVLKIGIGIDIQELSEREVTGVAIGNDRVICSLPDNLHAFK
jgi:hypothetical protein